MLQTFQQFFELFPIAGIICAGVFGLMVGSFLNVVVYRLPIMMERDYCDQCIDILGEEKLNPSTKKSDPKQKFNLVTPNSTCPKCGHRIKPWENIPVISYLFLLGKCSSCKTKISLRYPLVELATGLLSALDIYYFGATLTGLAAVFLTWCLIALTLIDFDTQYLPDDITLPLIWIGIIVNYYGVFTDLPSAIWGAIFGYMSLWLVSNLYLVFRGEIGMGNGDFKLLAALGAWLGWQMLLQIILLSSLVGAVIGISMILFMGRDKRIPIPFGPYLAIAGWIALFWGRDLNHLYLTYAITQH